MKSEGLLTACCECGKIRLGNTWLNAEKVEHAATELSHGYCPPCFEQAMLMVQAFSVSPRLVGKVG